VYELVHEKCLEFGMLGLDAYAYTYISSPRAISGQIFQVHALVRMYVTHTHMYMHAYVTMRAYAQIKKKYVSVM
jgi:hypothetical protein